MTVKKLAALTISILCAATAATGFGAVASAEEEYVSGYPESFVSAYAATEFTRYAANGKVVAFANGTSLAVFEGDFVSSVCEDKLFIDDFEDEIDALDFTEEDELVYRLSSGEDYYNLEGEVVEGHEQSEFPLFEKYGGYMYTNDIDGNLHIIDSNAVDKTIYGVFSDFTYRNGAAYAVDSGILKMITGGAHGFFAQAIDNILYRDFTPAESVEIGDAAEVLATAADKIEFVTVNEGYYATPVNISNLSDEYFKVSAEHTFLTKQIADEPALLLYKRDNLAIISIGDNSYLIPPAALTPLNVRITEEAVGMAANIADDCNPYSMPFISDSTKLGIPLLGGMEVWVVKRVYAPELLHDFYLIASLDDHDGIIGYVATGHVTEFHFKEDPPTSIPDPSPESGDYIRTVVLVLVVIVLVLIAAGYLTWVGTSGKKRKQEPPENENQNTSE